MEKKHNRNAIRGTKMRKDEEMAVREFYQAAYSTEIKRFDYDEFQDVFDMLTEIYLGE